MQTKKRMSGPKLTLIPSDSSSEANIEKENIFVKVLPKAHIDLQSESDLSSKSMSEDTISSDHQETTDDSSLSTRKLEELDKWLHAEEYYPSFFKKT